MAASGAPLGDHRLVVPDGLGLDPLTVARLVRRLDAAGPDVAAVVARPVVVPAGSSSRVLAERALTVAATAPLEHASGPGLRVAGVARPGADVTLAADATTVEGTGIWIDPTALAAERDASRGPLVDADPTGRAVFTRRPVVVIVLGEEAASSDDDPDGAHWAMVLADALLDHGTEARVALGASITIPAIEGGRTAPCALSRSTMAALRPDIVVTVGAGMRGVVETWCTERYTVLVEVEVDLHDRIELVSWRHGIAQGRVRARMGPHAPAAEVAALAARLCGGPPPVLPVGIDARIEQPVTVTPLARPAVRRRAAGAIRSVALVGSPNGPRDIRRWAGVAEQFALVGCTVTTEAVDPTDLDRFDLVLSGGAAPAALVEALAARRRRGAHSAALVGHRDVLLAADGTPSLSASAQTLAQATGRALLPVVALQDLGSVADTSASVGHWHGRVLPTVVTADRIAALEAAGTTRQAGREPALGWILDAEADPTPHLAVLGTWLDAHPDASLTVATTGSLPAALVGRPGIRVVDTLDPVDVAGWTAVVWSPAPGRAAGAGEVLDAVEIALVGVPVLATQKERSALGALGELVAAPTAEILALGPSDARHRGRRLHDRAAALHGARAAAVHAHRMLGWLLQDGER